MDEPEKSNASKTLGTVQRALDVLLLFGKSGTQSLGVSEISRELELPKAVVHRILTTLVSRGFLEVEGRSRRYRLGPAWLILGSTYLDNFDIRSFTQDTLRTLSRESNETATLSVRHGAQDRIYLDQVTPQREVRMSIQVGSTFPLHAGGSSKALLAFLSSDEQAEYLSTSTLAQLTDRTVTGREALADELAQIRKLGYATSLGERQDGAGSVAAPVLNDRGEPVAVISICGPADRIARRLDDFSEMLMEATTELSVRMGYRNARST